MKWRPAFGKVAALAVLAACCAGLPGRAWAVSPPVYVGSSVSGLSSGAVTSVTITAPSGLLPGQFMIAMIAAHVTGASGSSPAGWTVLQYSNSTAVTAAVYWRIATPADVAGTTTYKWTITSSRAAGMIMVYSGVSTSSPIASSAIQTNTAKSTFTAPAISSTASTTWVGLYAIGNGTTASSPPDMGNPYYSTLVVDASTGTASGANGILLGGFYQLNPTCCTLVWTGNLNTGVTAISVGVSVVLNGASPVTCAPATSGGAAPTDWPSYCWLDFSGWNDALALTAGGQTFYYNLADGSVLSFVATATSTGATALQADAVPAQPYTAIGNTAFSGIPNSPLLYTDTANSTVTLTFSNITLTPPSGVAAVSTYNFVAADGEGTNTSESDKFTTNGGNWIQLVKVPPVTGSLYPSVSNTGTIFTETGANIGTVGAYVAGSTNATQVSTTQVPSSHQGTMYALQYASISLNSTVASRKNSADQFTYAITVTSTGNTLDSDTTTGSGSGPFTQASSFISTAQPLTLSVAMASGSVTALTGYSPSLTCTNANSASTTPLPTNVITSSYVLSSVAYDDVISCVFANTTRVIPNHFAVTTPGTAVNCAPAAVTITAHSSTHAAVATTDTIAITTTTGNGDWTLTTGSGTFTPGGSDTGTATYTFATADAGVVVLALRDTHAETLTIGVADGTITATSGTATAAEDSPLTFVASGFIITNGSNAATSIGTQQAGVTSAQSLALQAVRTDTSTGACTSVFASGATVNVGLAYQCNNPTTCVAGQTFKLTNNGITTALASNPNSGLTAYTTVPLKFTTANAEAPFTIVYSDAGQVSLDAKYTIPLGSGAASGSTMLGAAQFVVQPYTLQLSGIKTTSGNVANPAASTPTGTVFLGAGQAFTATVTALNAASAATPNFGQETSPAAVTLTTNQVLATAVGGSDFPAVSGSFGTFASGVASGSAFSWPEVGIMTITPKVANYLGSGTVTGTTTGNVGRFIPDHFTATTNVPVFGTGCSAGGFTYLGQPFTYTFAPVITVTAQALGGTTTLNYTGSLFRLTNGSVNSRTYTPTPASPALDTTGLPATTSDPAIVSSGNGVGTLTFGAGTGLLFTRGTPIAPLSANIALSLNVVDLDAVAATTNPVTFGAGTGIAFSTGASQYYGRLALRNAAGSELLDLPMSLTTQYYQSTTAGFAANTADICTAPPVITFSNYLVNLSAGETCVRDSGAPGTSQAGCAAAASAALAYKAVPAAGNFNLNLAAPGAGNNGAVTVTATTSSWLLYLWNSGGVNSNPTGMATFGIFPGPASRIYQREAY